MSEALSYGNVKTSVSPVGMFLGWVAVFIEAMMAIGLLVVILSTRVLAEVFG